MAAVEAYNAKLQQSRLPKLLFSCTPGALIPAPVTEWCLQNLPHLKVVDLGSGIHFVQEDNPISSAQSWPTGTVVCNAEAKQMAAMPKGLPPTRGGAGQSWTG